MQAVNNILKMAMCNSNRPIKFVYLQKLPSQSIMNGAVVTNMTKTIKIEMKFKWKQEDPLFSMKRVTL